MDPFFLKALSTLRLSHLLIQEPQVIEVYHTGFLLSVMWQQGALDPVVAATLASPQKPLCKSSRLTYHFHCLEAPPEIAHLLLQFCQTVGR